MNAVNTGIKGFSEAPVDGLLDAEGRLKSELYSGDGLHLSAGGYKVFGKTISDRYLRAK